MTAQRLAILAREVAEVAAGEGVTLALLKGAALEARAHVAPGSRWAADVDVLASESALDRLEAALRERGFRPTAGVPECEHQRAPLGRGPGETVELHRFLPGVTRPGRHRFASLVDLQEAGVVEPLAGWPAGTLAPATPLLAAHALVHGIAQHGLSPRTYPLTRMLADLVDLGAAGPEGEALMTQAGAWTAAHVTVEEARLTHATVRALAAGRPEPSALLDHVLAGLLDDGYAASLKLRALGSGPSHRPRAFTVARDAWRAVFPGRVRLAGLSPGRSASRAALLRPFILAGRAARALAATLR
jgi:Uncharacterised nucleotidyltransferase